MLQSILSGNLGITTVLIQVLVLMLSLSFHEMSHAWMAYRLGDDTAAQMGRLTMNPMAHLTLLGSLCFLLIGLGWAKPVEVNPMRFRKNISMRKGMAWVSAAGPISNLILAFGASLGITILQVWEELSHMEAGGGGTLLSILWTFMFTMYLANVNLAIFNLLPIPPLDGSKLFGFLLPDKAYEFMLIHQREISTGFLLMIFLGSNIISSLMGILAMPVNWILRKPLTLLASWIVSLFA